MDSAGSVLSIFILSPTEEQQNNKIFCVKILLPARRACGAFSYSGNTQLSISMSGSRTKCAGYLHFLDYVSAHSSYGSVYV